MYRCPECGETFDELAYEDVCYEAECGVASLFKDRHWYTRSFCPCCQMSVSEDECYYDEEDEDEFEE